jgi:K+-transporting ATPase ATPase C chain
MKIFSSLKMFFGLLVLVGGIYPLIITGGALLTMKEKASGSLIIKEGKVVGSRLIGQQFENEKFFWPRPSEVGYNPLPSGASNLGPTSQKLSEAVQARKLRLAKSHGTADFALIPSDLLFASASGLDPHISVEAALFQCDRIARARHLKGEAGRQLIVDLITKHTEKPLLGFIGCPRINVLELNLALEELQHNG